MTKAIKKQGLSKTHIVDAMSRKSNFTKVDCERAIDAFMEALKECLTKGDGKVSLMRYLTFNTTRRKATTARNPRTGEKVPVAAKTVVRVKAGIAFQELFANE